VLCPVVRGRWYFRKRVFGCRGRFPSVFKTVEM
jgi:hypothetical protein